LQARVKGIDDEIEKGGEGGETVSFGVLFIPRRYAGKEG